MVRKISRHRLYSRSRASSAAGLTGVINAEISELIMSEK
jgi:hypothetical protein